MFKQICSIIYVGNLHLYLKGHFLHNYMQKLLCRKIKFFERIHRFAGHATFYIIRIAIHRIVDVSKFPHFKLPFFFQVLKITSKLTRDSSLHYANSKMHFIFNYFKNVFYYSATNISYLHQNYQRKGCWCTYVSPLFPLHKKVIINNTLFRNLF